MNAVTDIADLDAEPLDEGVGNAEARVRGAARAGEVGLVLLEVVEALALKVGRIVKDGAEDEGLDLKMVAAVRDLAQAYGKVCRSIRQNAMLEDKLESGLRDRVSGLEDARRARALKRAEAEAAKVAAESRAERDAAEAVRVAAWRAANAPRLAREEAVTEVMDEIIHREHRGDERAIERLETEYEERLEDEYGDYQDYGLRSVSETVKRLCEDMDLEPEWERWEKRAWAIEEAEAGVEGSPYVSRERGGTGECVLAVRGLQGAGLAKADPPGETDSS